MPSLYVTSDEYAAYELPSSTTQAQVQTASTLLDVYLKRPDGLVWTPDATGAPGWMAANNPAFTLTAPEGFPAGTALTVQVSGGISVLNVGDVLIADRANAEIAEPVVVTSILPNSVILQGAQFEHGADATLDLGMVIKQHKFMPNGRPLTNLAFTPVVRLLAGQGRYAYPRRGDANRNQVDDFNLLAALSHFGGPPAWEFFPMTNTNVDALSGQLWVPAGVMLSYYSEINLWYVAGFAAGNIPAIIKTACAEIVRARSLLPSMGAAKSYKAGDTAITMGVSSALSDDTKKALALYRAKAWA